MAVSTRSSKRKRANAQAKTKTVPRKTINPKSKKTSPPTGNKKIKKRKPAPKKKESEESSDSSDEPSSLYNLRRREHSVNPLNRRETILSSPKSFRGRVVEDFTSLKAPSSAKRLSPPRKTVASSAMKKSPSPKAYKSSPHKSNNKSPRKPLSVHVDETVNEEGFIDPKLSSEDEEESDLPQHVSDSRKLAKLFQERLEESAKSSRSPRGPQASFYPRPQSTRVESPVQRIIKAAEYAPKSSRIPRHPWTTEEENALREGVLRHGVGNWAKIRDDPDFSFHLNPKVRDNVALKDKWRNMVSYKEYSALPIRQYTILDKYHQPYRTRTGNLVCYRNRWPRDAALKAATKDEFYDGDPNKTTTIIYVKEIGNDGEESNIVHVYYAQRYRIPNDGSLPKFGSYRMRWGATVEKKREETMEEL